MPPPSWEADMKVNDSSAANKTPRAGSGVQKAHGAKADTPIRSASSADGSATESATVTISSDVGDVNAISAAARQIPELRPEVVEQAKEDLASGRLADVDRELLVARLLQDMGWFADSGE